MRLAARVLDQPLALCLPGRRRRLRCPSGAARRVRTPLPRACARRTYCRAEWPAAALKAAELCYCTGVVAVGEDAPLRCASRRSAA